MIPSDNKRLLAALNENWQAEMEGFSTYSALAKNESDPHHRNALRGLATAEKHHADLWAERIKALSPEIAIHSVPAQHGSGRTPFDRNRSHWCGWVIESAKRTIYFAGDTGYSPSFTDIGGRFGGFDITILPIGVYKPRWLMKPVHLDPADAVQAHLDLKSRLSVACHFGTFQLTDEPLGEPPALLACQLGLKRIDPASFRVLDAGQTIDV